VVAVANHNPDYSRFMQLIIPFVIHAACNFIGIFFIGLAMRLNKNNKDSIKDTARLA
jgi:large-conductance mechanosensitive channel